jgi:hypothetical protein
MKIIKLLSIYILIPAILQSCQNNNKGSLTVNCSTHSIPKLETQNIEDITLSFVPTNHDGILNINQSKGYRFTGNKGQKINYQIKSACAWLYSSDNKLIDTVTLPQNGIYILQIANLEGSGTFQLSINLKNSDRVSEQLPTNTAKINQDQNTASTKSNPLTELGWLRLGSVNNTNGTASAGDKLIRTTQAITIDPPEVPKKDDRVTIVNSVNLRVDVPQSPNYKLPQKRGIIQPGQKVTILDLTSFVDPTLSSPYTVVWAKIGVSKYP